MLARPPASASTAGAAAKRIQALTATTGRGRCERAILAARCGRALTSIGKVAHLDWPSHGGGMQSGVMSFTAVVFETPHGCVGFIEELPLVNSHRPPIGRGRAALGEVAALVFDAGRQDFRELGARRRLPGEDLLIPA